MSLIPFGKFKDQEIEEIPSGYLKWLVLQDFFEDEYPELLKETEEELAYRDTWYKHF